MKKSIKWRFMLIGALMFLSFLFLMPDLSLYDGMPGWWKSMMPDRGITLGLDLQGGSHLVYEVQGDEAVQDTLSRLVSAIRDTLEEGEIEAEVSRDGLRILVTPALPEAAVLVAKNYPVLMDSTTGEAYIYELPDQEKKTIRENAIEQALETIRNRIDQFGVAEPVIHRQAENEIVVQLPGIKDPKRAMDLIGKTAKLEFKIVDDESAVVADFPSFIPAGTEEMMVEEFASRLPEGESIYFGRRVDAETGVVRKIPYLLKNDVLLTGDLLTEARVAFDNFNQPYVSINFDSAGAKLFEDITGKNVQKRMAIVLDDNVYSAPSIRERIAGGSAQITGSYTLVEAQDLAIVLKAGALPVTLKIIQNVTVGASLGDDSIAAGKMAGIIGAIAVILFMVLYYRLSGVIADIALSLNIFLLLGVMASLNATLTLPGIAGIILAVGMAVDSNVLMFERMREELRAGKTPRAAVDSGYDKAFWTIFDSHVTTFITAAVLFQFGTGPIKGFAVTLSLGVLINLFTALVGTKTIFDFINSREEVTSLSI